MLAFCIEFLPPLLWRSFQARVPQESHRYYVQFHFHRNSLILDGEKVTGFLGGCDRVVLLVELALEERQVVKNWSGEKMFLVRIQVDRFLDVSVFSIVLGFFRKKVILVFIASMATKTRVRIVELVTLVVFWIKALPPSPSVGGTPARARYSRAQPSTTTSTDAYNLASTRKYKRPMTTLRRNGPQVPSP